MQAIPATSCSYTTPIPGNLAGAAIRVYAEIYGKRCAEDGALIDLADLRRAAGLPKTTFDKAVLALARSGRIQIQSHSLPASLTAAEREELIPNGRGSYFLAAGIRL